MNKLPTIISLVSIKFFLISDLTAADRRDDVPGIPIRTLTGIGYVKALSLQEAAERERIEEDAAVYRSFEDERNAEEIRFAQLISRTREEAYQDDLRKALKASEESLALEKKAAESDKFPAGTSHLSSASPASPFPAISSDRLPIINVVPPLPKYVDQPLDSPEMQKVLKTSLRDELKRQMEIFITLDNELGGQIARLELPLTRAKRGLEEIQNEIYLINLGPDFMEEMRKLRNGEPYSTDSLPQYTTPPHLIQLLPSLEEKKKTWEGIIKICTDKINPLYERQKKIRAELLDLRAKDNQLSRELLLATVSAAYHSGSSLSSARQAPVTTTHDGISSTDSGMSPPLASSAANDDDFWYAIADELYAQGPSQPGALAASVSPRGVGSSSLSKNASQPPSTEEKK
ncbi:MAG: hypothetical protein FJX71_03170 [Alphaproteobacteria bacterium]|nr:hypothetical protein [Alphaproteobacteria bacterium]